MNGAQDLGGAHGFGPVVPEPDEPVFHAAWERRVFAMAMAMGYTGAWNLDGSRANRESLPPAQYLASSYYEIWLAALEKQISAAGLATPDEITAGRASASAKPVARVLARDGLEARFRAGFPSSRDPAAPARFAVGDAVLARNVHPTGHTRLPRYVRGRRGRIERIDGAFVYPDTNAYGAGENPTWLYTVSFTARELWGDSGDPGGIVTVAAFEPYLEAA
ncbi:MULTISPECIES: nitrile hydratase subunit beta [Methylobacterium]|uniref:nitrile hydratase subunit beta n=2 Tax=Methylobacteriaceae TaxID=119045 RepID=UPI0011CB103F|nr:MULTISPECIES: nitrile hydratase subunit beta [Methylobacterium]TXN48244.1 nitrile hydratase subunit beta [Methylobacterium sp. WL7]GJE22996.1 Low-molecular weight cobalt-containing nitrile hydratase subunit beta [Methylobacterium mesophilicum]